MWKEICLKREAPIHENLPLYLPYLCEDFLSHPPPPAVAIMSAPGGQGVLLRSLLNSQGLQHSVLLYLVNKVKKGYNVISLA